jgi:hypothetical protein
VNSDRVSVSKLPPASPAEYFAGEITWTLPVSSSLRAKGIARRPLFATPTFGALLGPIAVAVTGIGKIETLTKPPGTLISCVNAIGAGAMA